MIEAKLSGRKHIEIWGDGTQTRSFTYVDDCVVGTRLIAQSVISEPLNLGSIEQVTINQLVSITEEIAEIRLRRQYNLYAPRGVSGRNSDNTKIRQDPNWEPSICLRKGLEYTYRWIEDEMKSRSRMPDGALRERYFIA